MAEPASQEGLQIVLTPLQLAAILDNESVEQSSALSNRIWGAVSLVGGAVELVGAAGLLLVPEPTTVTKIAGGALAVHGSDTAGTALVQIVTGRSRITMISQAAAAAAEALGATPDQARTVRRRWAATPSRSTSARPRLSCAPDWLRQKLPGLRRRLEL
jgi:hypothetical protein